MSKPLTVTTPSDREVVVVREFNAPIDLVWDAHTKPELVKRWLLGPDGWSMTVCEIDLRVGGAYKYWWRSEADGSEFGFEGVNQEISPKTRIVTTEHFIAAPGAPPSEPGINTLVLAEAGGKTILTVTMLYPSKEIRDMALGTGMTDGMEQSYQRLERVVLN